MFSKKNKNTRQIDAPMLVVLLFIVVPSTLVLVTEIASDKIIYRTLTQGYSQSE